ncbi:MAG TPA: lytic transglycosylase domain-containing protein [Solirubrobacterales bacterium]|nr:lytic transglycosylase domain-containing protein [Solirubrobacterales bacterium]
MRARTSARRIRSRSTKRRSTRTTKRRRSQRRRRARVVAGTLLVGALGGFLIANSDRFQRALQEVTLPLRHEDIIRQQAAEKGIPPDLIAAVIYAESRFRDQESNAGARGLMQVTPATAKFIERDSGGSTFEADDLSDPDINIRYGTYYLRHLIEKFDQNMVAALAAYNAGETNVAAWGGAQMEAEDIQFPETREYVDNVLEKRDEYAEHYRHELGLD